MKKKKYLPLYYKWLKTGVIPRDGLCHSLGIGDDYLGLFSPDYGGGYWGYWGEFSEYPILTQHVDFETKEKLCFTFNPLRQNIMLFISCMNNEL